jgi:hypothetical protein
MENETTMRKLLLTMITLCALAGSAKACLVKDPSGMMNVRNAPNGLVTGQLENGTLVIIEETRGDWVSITPYARRSETPVWVLYKQLDCNVDDQLRKAEREGKTPEQFAAEMMRGVKPARRTDQQLRSMAATAASTLALKDWCGVPLTYKEKVEFIVIGMAVGSDRLEAASKMLDERKKKMGSIEFCLRLEKAFRGKVEW